MQAIARATRYPDLLNQLLLQSLVRLFSVSHRLVRIGCVLSADQLKVFFTSRRRRDLSIKFVLLLSLVGVFVGYLILVRSHVIQSATNSPGPYPQGGQSGLLLSSDQNPSKQKHPVGGVDLVADNYTASNTENKLFFSRLHSTFAILRYFFASSMSPFVFACKAAFLKAS